jgi:hypothetical protein
MLPQPLEIGKLLRASTAGFVVGCRVNQSDAPAFGALLRVPVSQELHVYGLISDIHIDDDGLVRQLATADRVSDDVIQDNRMNRNVPLELSVLSVGYRQGELLHHLMPPRPPLSLDRIFLCTPEELCQFTQAGRFGYFRHILRAADLPVSELLAAHIQQAAEAHQQVGDPHWLARATQELITLLRDDYPLLMNVLGALGDIHPEA